MHRYLALLASLTLGSALAVPPPDCRPEAILLASHSTIIYSSLAQFPEPSRSVTLNFLLEGGDAPSSPVTLCGFRFEPARAKGMLTVTSGKLNDFSRIYRDGFEDTGVIVVENTFRHQSSGVTNRASRLTFDPKTFALNYTNPRTALADFTVGVKIDGGPIKPLFYQGRASVITVPKSARVVDVFIKPAADTVAFWEYLRIDLRQPSIQFQRKTAFPAK